MRYRDGSQVNLGCDVFKTRCFALLHQRWFTGVAHRPPQRVDVRFRLDPDGSAQAVACQHVHRRPMARAFSDVVENRHGVAACLGMVQHAVDEADLGRFHVGGVQVVSEGHERPS